jgi:hypothetical protein
LGLEANWSDGYWLMLFVCEPWLSNTVSMKRIESRILHRNPIVFVRAIEKNHP